MATGRINQITCDFFRKENFHGAQPEPFPVQSSFVAKTKLRHRTDVRHPTDRLSHSGKIYFLSVREKRNQRSELEDHQKVSKPTLSRSIALQNTSRCQATGLAVRRSSKKLQRLPVFKKFFNLKLQRVKVKSFSTQTPTLKVIQVHVSPS